ncbi:MAG: hypothetical protein ABEK12_00785 [Candidatus Nanohaloarchaea archaeon]
MPDLPAIRDRALQQRRKLPRRVRSIEEPGDYPVRVSDRLQATAGRVADRRS